MVYCVLLCTFRFCFLIYLLFCTTDGYEITKVILGDSSLEYRSLKTVKCRGDGNCLFNSFSKALFGHQEHFDELRFIACSYIRSNWALYKYIVGTKYSHYTAQQYFDFMRKNKVYAWNVVEGRALQEVFQVCCTWFKKCKTFVDKQTHYPEYSGNQVIMFDFVDDNHFNILVSNHEPPEEEKRELYLRNIDVLYKYLDSVGGCPCLARYFLIL